jgi:N-acetylmuramoyl-L-alanine amidase
MFSKILVLCLCLLVLSGCASNEPLPEIIGTSPSSEVILPSVKPPKLGIKFDRGVSSEWQPSPQIEKNWTAIIIHHSGTRNGNAAIFDKWHKEENHWDGVGYDFVIGNGSNSSDGQVETTYRWEQQKVGAHCGGTQGNWANKDGIGICLVGDFNQTTPSRKQMQSLVRLVQFLQERYRIPKSRIYGHGTTPGARMTDCPGKRFPMSELKSMVN